MLLVLLFLHVAHEGVVGELGAICAVIAALVGLVLLERTLGPYARPRIAARGVRGPPWLTYTPAPRLSSAAAGARSFPLRR